MSETPAAPKLPPLVGPDQNDRIPPERQPWRRQGIYWSDVCLAVHLSPAVSYWASTEQQEAAKAKLYAYLRGVHQTALEQGLVYPVACVVSNVSVEMRADMRRWSSDQDWHRGAFTLYFAENDAALTAKNPEDISELTATERLDDLLVPKPEALTAKQEGQAMNTEGYLERLESGLGPREDRGDPAAAMAREIMRVVREKIGTDRRQTQGEDADLLETWREAKIAAARRLL